MSCVWLLFLQCVVNLDTGEPTDELLTEAKQALAELGCNFTTVSEVRAAGDEKVHKAIMDGLKRYNETQAISNAQKVLYLGRDSDWMITAACFIVGFVRPSRLCHVFTMYRLPPGPEVLPAGVRLLGARGRVGWVHCLQPASPLPLQSHCVPTSLPLPFHL